MTPTLFIPLLVLLVVAVIYSVRRSRGLHSSRSFDLGVVSTRWLAELRRDEPWTRS
jgi:hypothetical protein